MSISSFMGTLGAQTTSSPKQQRGKNVVLHHASLEAIQPLEKLFVKPFVNEVGQLDWKTPEWFELLKQTAQR